MYLTDLLEGSSEISKLYKVDILVRVKGSKKCILESIHFGSSNMLPSITPTYSTLSEEGFQVIISSYIGSESRK